MNERLKEVVDQLVARGVGRIEFDLTPEFYALDREGRENALAGFLEPYLRGDFTVMESIGDAPASTAPVCGEDFCEECGDCIACYSDMPCCVQGCPYSERAPD
jgi:hypothetical protein